ncbi:MAG: transposase [Planctomycetota bacterium]
MLGRRRTQPKRSSKKVPRQNLLPLRQHGGRRAGAGRKPNGRQALVDHRERAPLAARFSAHVTVKLQHGLPRLRSQREYAALRRAFAAGCDRRGFRLTHYAVLNDHLHFLVEAPNRLALSRGVQGLLIRTARGLNKLLANGKKHAAEGREVKVPAAIDTFTSAPWFDGFREPIHVRGIEAVVRPVTFAHTWLLTIGWRRRGPLSVHDLPATG